MGSHRKEALKKIKLELTQLIVLAAYSFPLHMAHEPNQKWRRDTSNGKGGPGISFGMERLSEYILGKHISLKTDHKPLMPLLSKKDLLSQPP